MSKSSKAASQEKRLKDKRNKKAAMQALYDGYRDKGNNGKKKTGQTVAQNNIGKPKHKIANCGNAGCLKCSEINFKPFLVKGKPQNMPQWMYQKFVEEQNE